MSPDPATKPPGLLAALARPGIVIRVVDASGMEVARGIGELQLNLPEGLYVVEWSSGGVVTESLVRLKRGNEPTVVRYEPRPDGDSSARGPTPGTVSLVGSELCPSRRRRRSSVVVFVEADQGVSPTEAQIPVRLISRTGRTVAATRNGLPDLPMSDAQAALCYSVKPGRYELRFSSVLGEILDQSIPAIDGRQTIVFLRATRVSLLVADGEGFAQTCSAGIDPTRTIVISVTGDEDSYRISERVRLAGVLMHDLATNGGSLSAEFVAVLDDPATDPLLKLYGALVVLCRFEAGAPPALDEEWPASARALKAYRKKWATRAIDWIGTPISADWVTAMWQMARTLPEAQVQIASVAYPRRIEVPPMLECSWRWAIAQSVADSHAVPSSASLRAAARSAGATTPWLCWKATAAKAAPSSLPKSSSNDVDTLARDLASKSSQLLDVPDPKRQADVLQWLDPEIMATVMRAAQLSGLPMGISDPSALSQQLAAALALPVQQLRLRLARAVRELDAALARGNLDMPPPGLKSAESELLSKGPSGLAQRIEHPDDPNKGRFGGRATRRGFTLSASFAETSSRNLARVRLRVEGPAATGSQALFYLHDSFKPSEYAVRFKQGQAKLDVTAWGGFTVGAWIPGLDIHLELDLAKISGAPRIIRTR